MPEDSTPEDMEPQAGPETPRFLRRPVPSGKPRLEAAEALRNAAASDGHPSVETEDNFDEERHWGKWPVQFTKGLPHDGCGIVDADAYVAFVNAVNGASGTAADAFAVPTGGTYATEGPDGPFKFRAWESPRAGHAYDLSAPDGDTVGMAPAPKLGSRELTAEMGEVYALALLRDHDFTSIASESNASGASGVSPKQAIDALNRLSFFAEGPDPDEAPAARRHGARFAAGETALSGASVFRGSGPKAKEGPFLSQFLLAGSKGQEARGKIAYGAQSIDQRCRTLSPARDFMGDWHSWLDVQNGADMRGLQASAGPARFLSTPRDLASYVHVDQLYQAYLNAALILSSHGEMRFQPGFPSGKHHGTRDSFATFGGPDLLAVLTMVSSPALKAVRRQKFNYHRRCRPERLGGLLTLAANREDLEDLLGAGAAAGAKAMLEELSASGLLAPVAAMNSSALADSGSPVHGRGNPGWLTTSYLLPMAFPEGSPMHPSYGAGHATVAGACVTVLKAFFDTFAAGSDWTDLSLEEAGMRAIYVSGKESEELIPAGPPGKLTVSGELDKLAANIAIGRNMAGVHFHSDYYDSLRLGERVAIGMLLERMRSYQDPCTIRLRSFDGDRIELKSCWSKGMIASRLEVNGSPDSMAGWWARHIG